MKTPPTLEVALISEVFPPDRPLEPLLDEAVKQGAELAVLPELPLNSWSPATQDPNDEDAEEEGGVRECRLRDAAAKSGVAILGGVIRRDSVTGRRTNRALLFDREGSLLGSYDKLHLPDEPGFWEKDHYEPGLRPPCPIEGLALPLGIQICSDINRPEGSNILASKGAGAIVVPRATEPDYFDRWRLVMRAVALTNAVYVLSVNRPRNEPGVSLGGPSIVIGPDGDVIVETTQPIARASLSMAAVEQARQEYPGYLAFHPQIYARAWQDSGRS